MYLELLLRIFQKIHAVGEKISTAMWLVVRGKSAQYQSSESNLVKIVVAIMNHEPGGNQADVLRSCSIQKGCPWNETFVGDPDPDLRAQQYMPLLLQ